MKISLILYIVSIVFLFSFRDGEVAAQNFIPGYNGGGPISYSSSRNDDDFGFLLAILLLASRRRCGFGGGTGNCGCCNNARIVPVPYPIPFPTNNPIITRSRNGKDDYDDETSTGGDDEPIVNVITENVDNSSNISKSISSPKAFSGSSSNSRSGRGRGRRPRHKSPN